VDFARVRAAIDDNNDAGWVRIEGAVPPGAAMQPNYVRNREFLRMLF
jgi:hypothetical protein